MNQTISVLQGANQTITTQTDCVSGDKIITTESSVTQVITPVVSGIQGATGAGVGDLTTRMDDLEPRVAELEDGTDGLTEGQSPVDFFNLILNG